MAHRIKAAFAALLAASGLAGNVAAQLVIDDLEYLERDRPEAWAMNYMNAATTLTSAGATPELAAWRWQLALDVAHVPTLSKDQRRVGFQGDKLEDLNRSPVFARLRGTLGLPAGFVAELGYTPPLRVDGVRLEQMFAASLSRRLYSREAWSVSARVFGQHGYARGDITCPGEAVGSSDPELNPFDCFAPSDDRVALNHYGLDLTAAYTKGRWQAHGSLGAMRLESEVQLDALVFGGAFLDRTRLVSQDQRAFFVLGLRRELAGNWSLGGEWLYVPLGVRRELGAERERDALGSLRLQLRWQPRR